MFFEDHEKKIYSPASRPDLQFDPLAVDRALTRCRLWQHILHLAHIFVRLGIYV